uniref:Uncharacterized protein n=1 Tax=Myoviridae sp. ctX172 TaxID=2826663 RepID=A0A8S5QSD2_9CAUD|nr:MAG TPA: hypothetical protein [Myoviridae sp. ctX172]DAY78173.1 MAG TPA: hypothetical protein [Caudoviricetes sp.]
MNDGQHLDADTRFRTSRGIPRQRFHLDLLAPQTEQRFSQRVAEFDQPAFGRKQEDSRRKYPTAAGKHRPQGQPGRDARTHRPAD